MSAISSSSTQDSYQYYTKHPESWINLPPEKTAELAEQFFKQGTSPLFSEATHHCESSLEWRIKTAHNYYQNHLETWQALDDERIYSLFDNFLSMDLPCLPLTGTKITELPFNFSGVITALSDNQVLWYMSLMNAYGEQGDSSLTEFDNQLIEEKSRLITLASQPDVPVEALNYMIRLEELKDAFFPLDLQIQINAKAHEAGVKKSIWIWPITKEVIDLVVQSPSTLKWFHDIFTLSFPAYAAIDISLQESIELVFTEHNLIPIPDALRELDHTKPKDIIKLNHSQAWDWMLFLKSNSMTWGTLDREKALAFMYIFGIHNFEVAGLFSEG